MLDLSDLQPRKMPEWYELHLDRHRELEVNRLGAHILSMVHSQKKDYNAKVRVVITNADCANADQPDMFVSYAKARGVATAMLHAAEVVLRLSDEPSTEIVFKDESGDHRSKALTRKRTASIGVPQTRTASGPGPSQAVPKTAPSGKAWSFDD